MKTLTSLLANCEQKSVYVVTEKNAEILDHLTPLKVNREVKLESIEKIIKSISKGDWLTPIYVDSKTKEISEGNSRYLACMECRRRNIPFTLEVYFVELEDVGATCEMINNRRKNWTSEDRLNFYCKRGNESYIRLRKFMEDNPDMFMDNLKHKIAPALCLVFKSANMEEKFRNGELLFTDDHVAQSQVLMSQLRQIGEVLTTKQPFMRYNSLGWIKASRIMAVPFDKFLTRLAKYQGAGKWNTPLDRPGLWYAAYMNILN